VATEQPNFYAVVRLDSFRNWTPRPENVTVRKVHERLAEAEYEVRHLNATAPTGTVYFIQRTTVARDAKPPVLVAAERVAAAVAEVVNPRSRKARAERKAGKTKKKGKRK
jgi:hypothetical protein